VRPKPRPANEHLSVPAPHLRIVSEEFFEITALAALPQIVDGKTLVNLASPAGTNLGSVVKAWVERRVA
jgi:hypothetical protein